MPLGTTPSLAEEVEANLRMFTLEVVFSVPAVPAGEAAPPDVGRPEYTLVGFAAA